MTERASLLQIDGQKSRAALVPGVELPKKHRLNFSRINFIQQSIRTASQAGKAALGGKASYHSPPY